MKIINQNRKAYFNYTIEEEIEAGIMLLGSETKAIREGRININDAYITEASGALFLSNAVIGLCKGITQYNHEEKRLRPLLLHKREIAKLLGKMRLKGYSIVPTKVFFNKRNIVKVMIGLAKGKKLHDKRDSIKKRDEQRQKDRGEE